MRSSEEKKEKEKKEKKNYTTHNPKRSSNICWLV